MPEINQQLPDIVRAWNLENTILEVYRSNPRPPEKLPAHSHDAYQLCLSVTYPSEYCYRKEVHYVPVDSLSVIHPGELHGGTGRDVGDRRSPIVFRTIYIQPHFIKQLLNNLSRPVRSLPFFKSTVILDKALFEAFLQFHRCSQQSASRLSQDEQFQSVLEKLIEQYSELSWTFRPAGNERSAVRQIREYLHEHYAKNITLPELAKIVHLSPSYLSRVFKKEVGVSLSHYQIQIRIQQARLMLIRGLPIKQAATETGFVDQSHLTHHFKRFVQTTPGRYLHQEHL